MQPAAISAEKRTNPLNPPALVVVAPTYNHASALGGVLRSLQSAGLSIIVVNDGATDETQVVLAEWLASSTDHGSRRIVTHARNLGKAAALRTGFEEATRHGFTHALTIDTDGQHDGADIRGVVEAAQNRPDSLIIGARLVKGVSPPWASRAGRAISNWLVWLESGVRVKDSQSGMRVYPLGEMKYLSGSAERYGFETEVLTRAGWRGVPVIETQIRCVYDVPGGRTTHFRIIRDSLSAAAMHVRLIAVGMLPGHGRIVCGDEDPATGSIPRRLIKWFSLRRVWRMARGSRESQEQLATSFGVGLLMATLPIYGVKTAACLWLSGRLRLHPLVVIGTSSLSTPPLGLLFVLLSVCTGSLVLHGSWPSPTLAHIEASNVWGTIGGMLKEWIVGSVIAGTMLGLSGYWVARIMLSHLPAPSNQRTSSPQPATARSVALEER